MAEIQVLDLDIQGIKETGVALGVITEQVKALRKEMKATSDVDTYLELAAQIDLLKQKEAQLKAEQKAQAKAAKEAAAAVDIQATSYYDLNKQLVAARKAYKEMTAEQRNAAAGTELLKSIQALDKELKDLDKTMGQFQRNVGNYAGEGNGSPLQVMKAGFGGLGTSLLFVGSALGVGINGISEINTNTREYTKSLSELQSILGLTTEEVKALENDIADLSYITLESGVTIVNTGRDIADALKLAGSAKPELLGDAEALKEFTKQAIIFAQAGSMPVQDGIKNLAAVMAQFEAPASETARYMNAIAAGAKAGSAEIPAVADAVVKFGAGAKSAGVSIEETVALVETLGDKFIQNEQAGTALRNVLIRIKAPESIGKAGLAEMEKYGVSMEVLKNTALPLNVRLREFEKVAGDANAMVKIFGAENVTTGEILLNNVDRFDELTGAVTGTNEALTQASINTDNFDQWVENLSNNLVNMSVTIGVQVANALIYLGKVLQQISAFAIENKEALIAMGVSVAAVTLYVNASTIAFELWAASFYLAAAANKVLTLSLAAAPYVALGLAVFGVVTALKQWTEGSAEAATSLNKTQALVSATAKVYNSLADSMGTAVKQYVNERNEVQKSFNILRDAEISTKERAGAMQVLNEQYGDVIGFEITEKTTLDQLNTAQKAVNKSIAERIALETVKAKAVEISNKMADEQLSFELRREKLTKDLTAAETQMAKVRIEDVGKSTREMSLADEKATSSASKLLQAQTALKSASEENAKAMAGFERQLQVLPTVAGKVAETIQKVGDKITVLFDDAPAAGDAPVTNNVKNLGKAADATDKAVQRLTTSVTDYLNVGKAEQQAVTQGIYDALEASGAFNEELEKIPENMRAVGASANTDLPKPDALSVPIEKVQEYIGFAGELTASLDGLFDSLEEKQLQRSQERMARYDENIAKLTADLENSSGVAAEEIRRQIEEEQKLKEKAAKEDEELQKKQARRNKAFALAQAAINTALAVTSIIASSIDPTGITTAIRVAQALVLGGVQIAAIAATPVGAKGLAIEKMANGGTIPYNGLAVGRSHAQGGIKGIINGRRVEIEGGEFVTRGEDGAALVVNKRSTAKHLGLLNRIGGQNFAGKRALVSAINQDGGGIPLAAYGGAFGSPSPSAFISQSTQQSEVIDLARMAIQAQDRIVPVVVAQDVTEKQNERLSTAKITF